ncbi:HAD family hydrolase [Microbacterium sp. A8/3-1]|uniref:HAD family hydrolase n=1 Tax=Microbacterium sp. A8/3-1 TaxID=3160749 RepID=A0AAU7W3A4_9MICO
MTALLLDVDDTIVDTARTGWEKCQQAARELGLVPPSRGDFAALYGTRGFDECVQSWHPGVDSAQYRRRYDSLGDQYPPVPLGDVVSLLSRARAESVLVAILTNGTREKTRRKLAALGLDDADFDAVSCADDRATNKSDPATFDELRRVLRQESGETWMVSDLPDDWRVARRAGMRAIGVHASTWAGRKADGVDILVPTLDDLSGLIPLLGGSARRPVAGAGPVQAISFDVGGTLLEEIETPERTLRRVVGDSGQIAGAVDSAHWTVASSVWGDAEAIESELLSLYQTALISWGVESADYIAREAMRRHISSKNWRISEVAGAWLLANGGPCRLGVVSNWSPELEETLRCHGFVDVFEQIVCSSAVGASKPSREPYLLLAEALRLEPGQIAHLGDDLLNDVAAAHDAGMCGVLVGRHSPAGYLDDVMRVLL